MAQPKTEVIIIGGGVSGSLTASQLLRTAHFPLRIHLIEPREQLGRGVAYSTDNSLHLLNVPVGNMSALPDYPTHFLDWLQQYDLSATASSFVPRHYYGQYIDFTLQEAETLAHPMVELIRHQDEAVNLHVEPEQARVFLKSGDTLLADQVVLAFGNFPPSLPNFIEKEVCTSPAFIPNPWDWTALDDIPPQAEVLFIGSGLTMIDLVLSLKTQGHTGQLVAISRHGLSPLAHRLGQTYPLFLNPDDLPQRTSTLVNLVLTEIQRAQALNIGWRAVIDSLRPITQQIWENLPLAEQQQFLRHIQPYWEIVRHRVAPEIAEIIAQLQTAEQLLIQTGRFRSVYLDDKQELQAEVQYPDGEIHCLKPDYIVNCTGANADYQTLQNVPLIQNLLAQKLIQSHPLHLGLAVSPCGATLDANGLPSEKLYTIGSLRKGQLWESLAMPEIRVQAAQLAQTLLKQNPNPA